VKFGVPQLLRGATVKACHVEKKSFESIFVHTGIVGGLGSLIWIAWSGGERIELVDVVGRPVQEVDGLVPEGHLNATGAEGASNGLNVAAKESCSMPGAGLAFQIRDEPGVGGAAFLAVLALSFLFFPLSPAAFFFGAFGLYVMGALVEGH
jgi:hypothetical protein